MRTLVIGDIHGGLLALLQVLKKAQVKQEDTLIFLGDYADGWSQTPELIDFLIDYKKTHHCIFIRGNHDELLLHWLINNHDNPTWLEHGGASTIAAYKNISNKKKQEHITFLESLENYFLDNENRLFIHAGFTNLNGIEHEHFPRLFYWDRTLWELAVALDKNLAEDDSEYPRRLKLYKEIFIGHTPVTKIGETKPTKKATVWNVDTGAAFKGKLSIMDINSYEYWQSDELTTLYPNENGRNK